MRAHQRYSPAFARALALVTAGLLIISTLLSGALPASANTQPASGTPIVFVHGYQQSPWPGDDVRTMPKLLTEMGAKQGRTVIPVGYYMNDVQGPSVQASGTPGAGYASGKRGGLNTADTDIRHLAYQTAWWIYDNYSSKGQAVDLIGHSMGGLIIRYLVWGVRNERAWPPKLLIEDAITVSTPHLGLPRLSFVGLGCVGTGQCNQMFEDAPFMVHLKSKGRGPRATGHTDWTAIGAVAGDILTADQLTNMGADHVTLVANSGHADYFTVPSSVQLMLDAAGSPAK